MRQLVPDYCVDRMVELLMHPHDSSIDSPSDCMCILSVDMDALETKTGVSTRSCTMGPGQSIAESRNYCSQSYPNITETQDLDTVCPSGMVVVPDAVRPNDTHYTGETCWSENIFCVSNWTACGGVIFAKSFYGQSVCCEEECFLPTMAPEGYEYRIDAQVECLDNNCKLTGVHCNRGFNGTVNALPCTSNTHTVELYGCTRDGFKSDKKPKPQLLLISIISISFLYFLILLTVYMCSNRIVKEDSGEADADSLPQTISVGHSLFGKCTTATFFPDFKDTGRGIRPGRCSILCPWISEMSLFMKFGLLLDLIEITFDFLYYHEIRNDMDMPTISIFMLVESVHTLLCSGLRLSHDLLGFKYNMNLDQRETLSLRWYILAAVPLHLLPITVVAGYVLIYRFSYIGATVLMCSLTHLSIRFFRLFLVSNSVAFKNIRELKIPVNSQSTNLYELRKLTRDYTDIEPSQILSEYEENYSVVKGGLYIENVQTGSSNLPGEDYIENFMRSSVSIVEKEYDQADSKIDCEDLHAEEQNAGCIDHDDVELSYDSIIGEGNFGKVYHGLYQGIDSAFKTFDEIKLDDYRNESVLFAKASQHKCVCRYYGIYYSHQVKRYFLVMEFWKDGSLQKVMKTHSFTTLEKISICNQLVKGVWHIHKSCVIHADIALRNVLIRLREHGEDSQVAISDFGQACLNPCTSKMNMLSPRWCSPNFLKTRIPTLQSDIWALSVCFWEIFSDGTRPYDDKSQAEVLQGLVHNDLFLECDPNWPMTPILKEIFQNEAKEHITSKWVYHKMRDLSKTLGITSPRKIGSTDTMVSSSTVDSLDSGGTDFSNLV